MKKNSHTFPLIAKTLTGLEEVLQKELTDIGALNTQVLKRAVRFEGDKTLLYTANYCCRTALRILKPFCMIEIKKQEDLYNGIREIPWETVLDPSKTLAVDSVISDSVFTNSQYVAQKTKDAVVDRLRAIWNARPSVELDDPDIRINIHLHQSSCTVSIDSSGQSLHKRGYRRSVGPAPMNEVLAAGLILLTGWDQASPFVDPMCGSGTLLIEAAMLANHIPAGYFRKDFGFMKWKDFDAELWHMVKGNADQEIRKGAAAIVGSDMSPKAVEYALENIRYAKMISQIKVEVSPFEQYYPPEKKGIVVTNPPYDERLHLDDIISFYKRIGDILKNKYTGYEAWIISSDLRALKFIGLHPSKKITLYNGPLECRFVRFSLY